MTVRELIGGDVVWVGPEVTLLEAAKVMKSNEIGSLAVGQDDALEGIFTERDLLDACADETDLETAEVGDWMTAYPDSFNPEVSVEQAASWMTVAGYRHLPVVDGTEVIGVLSIKDILWALTESAAV